MSAPRIAGQFRRSRLGTGRIALAVSGAATVALAAGLFVALVGRPIRVGSSAVAALPPVSARELIDSVRSARPGPMSGTVRIQGRLGLIRPLGDARVARLWSDGTGRRRVSLPNEQGERTIVDDGKEVWFWNSATRSATRAPVTPDGADGLEQLEKFRQATLVGNPARAASAALALLVPESIVRIDPNSTVADRPVYQLVLAPVPTERTMLREVRVAVDGQTRMPLRVSVLTNGSATPALSVGFEQISFGPQNPALFRFSPAPLARVREQPHQSPVGTLIGQGWDAVLVGRLPPGGIVGRRPPEDVVARPTPPIGRPISGPWGHGVLINTPIGAALLTDDGRLAAGAVPAQVLTKALCS